MLSPEIEPRVTPKISFVDLGFEPYENMKRICTSLRDYMFMSCDRPQADEVVMIMFASVGVRPFLECTEMKKLTSL